jgi:hypothetical protein
MVICKNVTVGNSTWNKLSECDLIFIIFDSSNAVLGMAFTPPPPPRKGNSVLYGRDKLCTA